MVVRKCIENRCVICCFRCVRWLPVIFIVAVVCWSYFAYVYELCIKTVQYGAEKAFYLIFYHIFLFMFLWAYWQTTLAELGRVSSKFMLPNDLYREFDTSSTARQRQILDQFSKNLPVMTRSYDGSIRYCDKCRIVKPDRAHHCSICGFCVLKMDHHCPWVNTCVSYTNYKFFILFLGYAFVYCIYVALTDLRYFIKFWEDSGFSSSKKDSDSKPASFHVMFLFFVACMFAISVSVLFFYHLWLTSKNRSTLEAFRAPVFITGPDKDGFSLGYKGNFQEVFGDRLLMWFLPVFSSRGDGNSFPINLLQVRNDRPGEGGGGDTVASIQAPAETSQTATANVSAATGLGDGASFPVCIEMESDGLLNDRRRWIEDGESDVMSDSDHDRGKSNSNGRNSGERFQLHEVMIR